MPMKFVEMWIESAAPQALASRDVDVQERSLPLATRPKDHAWAKLTAVAQGVCTAFQEFITDTDRQGLRIIRDRLQSRRETVRSRAAVGRGSHHAFGGRIATTSTSRR